MINTLLGGLRCQQIISSLGNVIHGSACGLTMYEFPRLDLNCIRPARLITNSIQNMQLTDF